MLRAVLVNGEELEVYLVFRLERVLTVRITGVEYVRHIKRPYFSDMAGCPSDLTKVRHVFENHLHFLVTINSRNLPIVFIHSSPEQQQPNRFEIRGTLRIFQLVKKAGKVIFVRINISAIDSVQLIFERTIRRTINFYRSRNQRKNIRDESCPKFSAFIRH